MQIVIIIMLGVTAIAVTPFLFKCHIYFDANTRKIAGDFGVLMYNVGASANYNNKLLTIIYGNKTKIIALEDLTNVAKKPKRKFKISIKKPPKIVASSVAITVATNVDSAVIMPYITAAGVMFNSVAGAIDMPTDITLNVQSMAKKSVNCIDVSVAIKWNLLLIISSIFTILVNSLIATRRANERSRN